MSIMPRSTSSVDRPAWKSHPIYHIRLAILIIDAIGAFLALFSIPTFDRWSMPTPIFDILFLGASIAFVLWDLITFSQSQSQTSNAQPGLPQHSNDIRRRDDNEDNKKKWPRVALVIWDIIFALVLHWMFWVTLGTMGSGYSYDIGAIVLQSYVALALLIASFLHAWSFWKELMARKQQSWAQQLICDPCPQCGYEEREPEPEEVTAVVRGLNDSLKKKLAQFLRKERDADAADDDTEESLLITPDESGPSTQKSYGGLDETSQAMEASEERVVKKKGKARAVDT